MFKTKIFREYDIRGVYNEDYDAAFAETLGRGFAQIIKQQYQEQSLTVAVGRDARESGITLSSAFSQGLQKEGIQVLDLGVVPTPAVYFAAHQLKTHGAVCITGSHNPSEYNGFKSCVGTSTLHGEQIQRLKDICLKIDTVTPTHTEQTKPIKHYDILKEYSDSIIQRVALKNRKLKVVVDSGNGAASHVAPGVLERLGCEVIPLFCELDGSFPNHHPDPTVIENLEDLRKKVIETKADLGIAFDGDADRIGAVDENGLPVYGDELLVLFAREILSRKPGATIISEVKSSHRLYNDIRAHGGNPIMWKTGHSLIKAKMKETNAELAGEMSGHIFFSDRYFGFDDAIYAAARLIEILSATDSSFSKLLDLPCTVNTPEIRVDCPDELKFAVVDQVKKKLSPLYKTVAIDGVRIETATGWGLLRASNTQPVVVMRFEAQTQNELDLLQNVVETSFKESLCETTKQSL